MIYSFKYKYLKDNNIFILKTNGYHNFDEKMTGVVASPDTQRKNTHKIEDTQKCTIPIGIFPFPLPEGISNSPLQFASSSPSGQFSTPSHNCSSQITVVERRHVNEASPRQPEG